MVQNSVTYQEIVGQPQLWKNIATLMNSQRDEIKKFCESVLTAEGAQVILSGAGSSAFVGESIAGLLQKQTQVSCRAVATTDLVTNPQLYVLPERPLLMISFARSGNSPESKAALEIVTQLHPQTLHLVITCNRDGALAQMVSDNVKIVLLPDEANDRGLAMIGSVTGMIATALLLFSEDGFENKIIEAAQQAEDLIRRQQPNLQAIAQRQYKRAICLGSGPLLGIAREAHLKLQELSDGSVMSQWDSFLGFRHGPRAIVNSESLLIYFVSRDPYVARYERDLIESIQNDESPIATIAISYGPMDVDVDLAIEIPLSENSDERSLLLPFLVPVQLLAVLKSVELGLNPDSPSERGAIHRVVQGVKIYPFQPNGNQAVSELACDDFSFSLDEPTL